MTGLRVLAVCTGNICRSPTIERLLLHRVSERFGADAAADWAVTSAGTWGHEGSAMEEFAAACLLDLGADPSGFVARELTPEMIDGADLILAATREHRASVATLEPEAARRTFTVLEFARLLADVDPSSLTADSPAERMRELAVLAADRRGPADPPSADDLDDPYGAPRTSFARVATVIDDALAVPLALVGQSAAAPIE